MRAAARCSLPHAIGVAQPVSIRVDTFGTAAVDEGAIEAAVEQVFDLRPAAIIEALGLKKPIYRAPRPTATWAAKTWAWPGKTPIRPPR